MSLGRRGVAIFIDIAARSLPVLQATAQLVLSLAYGWLVYTKRPFKKPRSRGNDAVDDRFNWFELISTAVHIVNQVYIVWLAGIDYGGCEKSENEKSENCAYGDCGRSENCEMPLILLYICI